MNIGQASKRSGLSPKTIRYYEEAGLFRPDRRANGFRDYGERELEALRLVARARTLGFTVEECRHLLALHRDQGRASADVKQAASEHLATIRQKIAHWKAMEATLTELVERCAGDERTDCAILRELAR